MKKIVVLLFFLFSISLARTQLLSWTPSFPADNDASTIVITVDATKGNQGLLNYASPMDVYVHIGLITDSSATETSWHYSKFTWGTPNPQAQATYIGNNKWTYTIIGGIRTFFNVTSGIGIKKIAILFRNGDGSKAQRNTDGSDMYVPVYNNSLVAVRFTDPPFQPFYTPQPEPLTKSVGDNISLSAIANKNSSLKLYLNGVVIQTAASATSITV